MDRKLCCFSPASQITCGFFVLFASAAGLSGCGVGNGSSGDTATAESVASEPTVTASRWHKRSRTKPTDSATVPPAADTVPSPAAPANIVPAELVVVSGNRFLYVSPSGSDSSDGLSEANPFQTIQRGVDAAEPGDTVLVRDGTYAVGDPNSNIVTIGKSGNAAAWISVKAYPGEKPLLKSANWQAISVQASYILVEGFKIIGNRDQISADYAASQASNISNPLTGGNGIGISPRWQRPDLHSHHVVIRSNEVYNCSGGGIYTTQSDYVLIESNTVAGNAWWSPYAGSGISVYQNWNSDSNAGYKMIVRGNMVAWNSNKIPFYFSDKDPSKRVITDGNGIIVDDARNTQEFSGNKGSPYAGRTLVDSNLVVENGARGVNVFSSDHVDVVNNTTYQNAFQSETPDGEVSIFDASDVRVFNNILSARADRPSLKRNAPDDGIHSTERASHSFGRNIAFSGTGFDADVGDNLIGVDPQFVDAAGRDFHVGANSPAVDSANSSYSFSTALYNAARYLGKGPDIGAFENR
jgi:parallel beta-helix repeat protein